MAVDLNRIRALSDAMRDRVGRALEAPPPRIDIAWARFAGLVDYDPFQLRDPHTGEWIDTGVPERAKKFMRSITHVADLAATVDDLREGRRTELSRVSLSGGASGAGVDLVTLDNGVKLIHKRPARWSEPEEIADQNDAEQLASLVSARFGVPVAGVYRDEKGATWSAYVPGRTMGELDDNARPGRREIDRFMTSVESQRMGLVHMLIGNNDANSGNLIVGEDGQVTGIDHSYAFGMLGYNTGGETPTPADMGPPEDRPINHFIDRGSGATSKFVNNPLTEQDVESAREILEGLRPDFRKLGREGWLDKSLQMLDELDAYGDGTVNLL